MSKVSIKTNSLVWLILSFWLIQQVTFTSGFNFLEEDETSYLLPCELAKVEKLEEDCEIIKVYNRARVDSMSRSEIFNVTKHCACQLSNMDHLWRQSFYKTNMKNVASIVERLITRNSSTIQHPVYIWSDFEVTVYKISIYTATKDYFEQQISNKSLRRPIEERRKLEKDPVWVLIRGACRLISEDSNKLYQYLENLNRVSPEIFFRLVNYNEVIESVYQASKACKLLLIPKVQCYKLKPDNPDFYAVDPSVEDYLLKSQNLISENDVDTMLKYPSINLLNCGTYQEDQSSFKDLNNTCPMMMNEKVPLDWIVRHPSPSSRSLAAIKCGCQLLLYNSTWQTMVQDPDVSILIKALTTYMNLNRPPNFVTTPVWTIQGWFNDIMSKFIESKQMSIQEIIKVKLGQDPSEPINGKSQDSYFALEILRRACNFIMFNYKKGTKEAVEHKLIKYLDNLHLISQDPLFVFYLTLQDQNLFKLHALSKMCLPVIR